MNIKIKLNFLVIINYDFNLEHRTVLFCSMRTVMFNVNVNMNCSVF